MNIVVLHYHFHAGGVLQVVLGHLRGLAALPLDQRPRRLILLHGGRDAGLRRALEEEAFAELPIETHALPCLEYDDRRAVGEVTPDELQSALTEHLRSLGLSPHDAILHAHNPTLGRNVAMPPTIQAMAARGWRWLLQIHDFAEDLRPENLLALIRAAGARDPLALQRWLYPQGAGIAYATLVSRDAVWLEQSGIPASAVGTVPNPIMPPAGNVCLDRSVARAQLNASLSGKLRDDQAYLLYPVRGIRRKHLGEVLLWAALGEQPAVYSITLPPTTPLEIAGWQRWQHWSEALELPVVFGSGLLSGMRLETNRAAADAVLTTSVAEGFGMAFLEPWLQDRPVIGRDLPNATDDFRRAGIEFDGLYETFPIPVDHRRATQFSQRRQKALAQVAAGLPATFSDYLARQQTGLSGVADASDHTDTMDFASLVVADQIRVLARIRRDAGFRRACRQAARGVLALSDRSGLRGNETARTIAANRQCIGECYAPQAIAKILLQRYQRLLGEHAYDRDTHHASTSRDTSTSAGTVLGQVASTQPVFPLRAERKIEQQTFLRLQQSLTPLPTDMPARVGRLPDIRAVVFDIYGTLIISGSGDVGSADLNPRESAMLAACETVGVSLGGESAGAAVARLHAEIVAYQKRVRERGVEFPEVQIVDVWETWLRGTPDAVELDCGANDTLSRGASREKARRLSEEFEARANPCAAMPGAADLLDMLRERGSALGIVSNAQHFTPTVVSTVLDRAWPELGFARDLTYFSYRFAEAKPGPALFSRLVKALQHRGIAPHQAIYLGNDMLNDVMAAQRAGLRTVLFAGDRRSLRTRPDDARVTGVEPDAVIVELSQLLDIV